MKTIICDIDGTLLDYLHDKSEEEQGFRARPHPCPVGAASHPLRVLHSPLTCG